MTEDEDRKLLDELLGQATSGVMDVDRRYAHVARTSGRRRVRRNVGRVSALVAVVAATGFGVFAANRPDDSGTHVIVGNGSTPTSAVGATAVETTVTVSPTTAPSTTIVTATTISTTAAPTTVVETTTTAPTTTSLPDAAIGGPVPADSSVASSTSTTKAAPSSSRPAATVAAPPAAATTTTPRAATTTTTTATAPSADGSFTCAASGDTVSVHWSQAGGIVFTSRPGGSTASGEGTDSAKLVFQTTIGTQVHKETVTAKHVGGSIDMSCSDVIFG